MKRIPCVLALALLGSPLFAQSVPPTNAGKFSITAQAMSLPGGGQTVAAAMVGSTFAISPNLSLRGEAIMAGSSTNAYAGGVQYVLPSAKLLAKSTLNPKTLQFYVTGSLGVDRVAVSASNTQQHLAALAGGGINYSPMADGKFSIGLVEVRWARLPGLTSNTALVSSGLKLSF